LEFFVKLPHDELIKCFGNKKYDILITLRNQSNLLYSRYHHPGHRFFLQKSINKFYETGVITKDIIQHYNYTNLIQLLRDNGHKVTYIWYEDLMQLEKKSIKILAYYLNISINKLNELLTLNINTKVNANTYGKKSKINVDEYFDNSKLNYEDII
jgi:hypothetical protein